MGWTVRGSNPGGGEIFRSRPDRPWGPPSLLYNGYWVSFPGVKRPGRGVAHPPSSSARVKERVELYLYSPSGPSWPVLGRTLPFTFRVMDVLIVERGKSTTAVRCHYGVNELILSARKVKTRRGLALRPVFHEVQTFLCKSL
jgi:hypothetical protein